MQSDEIKQVRIVYYSGTGSTKKVAQCFEEKLKDKGIIVITHSVREIIQDSEQHEDLLLVVYAVHGLNAPEAVYRWIDEHKSATGGKAVVISVSGGGETTPNTACRVRCIHKLKKKGYDVVYERMLVMPSNWIVETKEPLAVKLLEVLPNRVEAIVKDILSGVRRKFKPGIIDRMLARVCELEKIGAKEFGKRLKCKDTCTGCGWCNNHCPSGNINMKDGKPSFGGQCHMCLNCIYGCPQKAIEPGMLKFIVIKNGYNLKELEKKVPYPDPIDVKKLAAGYVWSGVRKYLLEDK